LRVSAMKIRFIDLIFLSKDDPYGSSFFIFEEYQNLSNFPFLLKIVNILFKKAGFSIINL
jgi:hypothetical protein